MSQEITSLLDKEVVEPVSSHQCVTGSYCNLFLVPKQSGGLRPILNLCPCNEGRRASNWTASTQLKTCCRGQDFSMSLDLQDAYLYIAMLPTCGDEQFQFQALPLDLSSAPRAFCRTLAPVVQLCHIWGLKLLDYLDDWLLLCNKWDLLHSETYSVCQLLTDLGWILVEANCQLTPSQRFPLPGGCFQYKH
jgi:hypothetical protein